MNLKKLYILGTRGIPAQHGGFETFAERLALHLAERNWRVGVYCQEDGNGAIDHETSWNGIQRIHLGTGVSGTLGTIQFDLRSVLHALNQEGIFLTLGYNTAIFNVLQRIKGQINIINMDGIEWSRSKWSKPAKCWLWLNERIGCWTGDHLIADHPEIQTHLEFRANPAKISMIPYGADEITNADSRLLTRYGVQPGKFSVVIARPEPENSLLEIVSAFSRRERAHRLLVLGDLKPSINAYHQAVVQAAGKEVVFIGAVFDRPVVNALRYFSRLYLHGHRVGGTNPSLVEAMGASAAVLAHDNRFNRWVAGTGGMYFSSESECDAHLNNLLANDELISVLKQNSLTRFRKCFTWSQCLQQYENLLEHWSAQAKLAV